MKEITKLENGRIRVRTINKEPSKTDQQYKEDCDVNYIMQKYTKTKQITHISPKQGYYGDVSDLPDLISAEKHISTANEWFMTLDSSTRKMFNNSPAELYAWLQDPKNKDAAMELGIIEKPPIVREEKPPIVREEPPIASPETNIPETENK